MKRMTREERMAKATHDAEESLLDSQKQRLVDDQENSLWRWKRKVYQRKIRNAWFESQQEVHERMLNLGFKECDIIIKSHCEYPDFERTFYARDMEEAIAIAKKEFNLEEWDNEYIKNSISINEVKNEKGE